MKSSPRVRGRGFVAGAETGSPKRGQPQANGLHGSQDAIRFLPAHSVAHGGTALEPDIEAPRTVAHASASPGYAPSRGAWSAHQLARAMLFTGDW